MSFLEILQELVDGVDGAIAATIMGLDGIPIQQYAGKGDYDVETVGVEYGKVVDEIKHAATLLNLGEVEEIMIATLSTDVLLRMVSPEYYITFVISGKANIGKARYMLKRAAAKAKKEIAS